MVLSEYVFRKIKRFCEKIFFRVEGLIFGQNSVIYCSPDPATRFPFPPILSEVSDKIDLSQRVFGVGRPSAVQNLGRVTGSDFPQILSVLRADLVLQKGGSFFVLLTHEGSYTGSPGEIL